ncbi:MAG: glycerol-3-phosphate dehydrogenase/oxidase [Acidobacteria bacterium]|nr:glycerol-3-phosphate dehydrogenase/oxidase [Acidobacteriota bacterium]
MKRDDMLAALADKRPWDFLVIGGGATGLGTAVEAVSRGYRTLLVEQSDFAKGTSSRSTKLIHGGVRYLEQGDVGLVLEALRERDILCRNAPHLVHPLAFVVPAYRRWERLFYWAGLRLYDLLARSRMLGKTRVLSATEARELVPTLAPDGLRGGVLYYDAQFDDARLAVNLAEMLVENGGTALNYLQVTSLVKANGRVQGVVVRDAESGEEQELHARIVVNATGVFADAVRRMDNPVAMDLVRPSQGVHLVLDKLFLPGETALMVPRTDDGRILFAIPWHGVVLLGTTDTEVGKVSLEPRPLEQEIDFLLDHSARYLTRAPRRRDVRSAFAGLRPLVQESKDEPTSAISRDHELLISRSGLVTITGGKWTTYRKMGEDVVTQATRAAGLRGRPSMTRRLRIHGWQDPAGREDGLAVYGSDAPRVSALIAERPEWSQPLHPDLPYLSGEVAWATRYEMARTVEDVLARRTRALFLNARASMEAAPAVARLMAQELGRDAVWEEQQVASFRQLAGGYVLP